VNLQLLKARQTKYIGYATLYIVVVLAIVSTANILANRYNKTYDATSNKRYSLSEQTAKIVKGLKEDAKITYFDQGTHFERAKDQLDLYANLSHKVHIDYVDVDKKPQLAREAGIKNYGTTVVQIGAKREEAKSTSEEDITGAFIRALKNNARTVCLPPEVENTKLTIPIELAIRACGTFSPKRNTPQNQSAFCKRRKSLPTAQS